MKGVYVNRELSWLAFNGRVLEEARGRGNPLCERLSFLSIFQSNLDEAVAVRVGALADGERTGARDDKTGLTAKKQLSLWRERERRLLRRAEGVYRTLMGRVANYGIAKAGAGDLTDDEKKKMKNFFRYEIYPFLSPEVIGKRQPFPFLKNGAVYAVVGLESKKNGSKLGIVPCMSETARRVVRVSDDGRRFMLLEELIAQFAADLFERYEVKERALVRVIRSADIDFDDLEDYAADYRSSVEAGLRIRTRLAPLELDYMVPQGNNGSGGTVIDKVREYLSLSREQVFRFERPFDLSFLSDVQDLLRGKRELFFPRRVPQQPRGVARDRPMIEQIEAGDILLSFPFETIRPFLTLLTEAAQDPAVVSIKMTLYRVAANSKIVEALIDASENGKEVVVLMELRARFDEENNIRYSRQLEDAGCAVIYGLDHLKVHSKLCLITRRIARAVPGAADGESRAIPGAAEGESRAIPGAIAGEPRAIPGAALGEGRAVPGAIARESRAVPGAAEGEPRAIPGAAEGERRKTRSLEYITQVGTGNYNEKTSVQYTDYSLMTANYDIGSEVSKVFNALSFGETLDETEHLLVAPNALKNKIIDMIDGQAAIARAGGKGYIGLKMNALTDRVIIDKLIEASCAGVRIQMIIRGICCLKAGVAGKTENIEVRSIVGRFLEHSRIYIFGSGDAASLQGVRVYISSADFMTRNTTHRVEVAVPIYDSRIKQKIISDFNMYLKDNVKAREQVGGVYKRVKPKEGEEPFNAQEYFYTKAYGE